MSKYGLLDPVVTPERRVQAHIYGLTNGEDLTISDAGELKVTVCLVYAHDDYEFFEVRLPVSVSADEYQQRRIGQSVASAVCDVMRPSAITGVIPVPGVTEASIGKAVVRAFAQATQAIMRVQASRTA